MSLRPPAVAARADLRRSIPFWILLVGSLASAGVGTWLILDKISTMTTTLADGSATGVEVYAGQSWITVGGALLAAGLIGLVVVLALGVARSFVPAPAAEVVEVVDWTTVNDADVEATADEAATDAAVLGYEESLGYAPDEPADDAPKADAEIDADADAEKPAASPSR